MLDTILFVVLIACCGFTAVLAFTGLVLAVMRLVEWIKRRRKKVREDAFFRRLLAKRGVDYDELG